MALRCLKNKRRPAAPPTPPDFNVARQGNCSAGVEACADAGHHALVFGDLNDAQGPLASALAREETEELRSDLKLNTAVRYFGI